jgi:hypothetical protein
VLRQNWDRARVAKALDDLERRIATIIAAVADRELCDQLSVLRQHIATTATILEHAADSDQARISARLDHATSELVRLIKPPEPRRRRPYRH